MTTVFFDIESTPVINDTTRAIADDMVKCPGTIKLAASKEKWLAEDKPKAVEDLLQKGGLNAALGRVLAFSYALDDAEPVCVLGEESDVLRAALDVLAYEPLRIYSGFNISGFDLPFLKQRMWASGLTVPNAPFRVKPWADCIADLMLMWDKDKNISLHRLCLVLGVASPKQNGMDGSQVWPMYQAGKLDEIRAYALADVVATRACYRLMA